jgi:hypothetical protein
MDLRRFLENTSLQSCQGISWYRQPFFAAFPSTIGGMVERGIRYFKPKISDRAKLEILTTNACRGPENGGFPQPTG